MKIGSFLSAFEWGPGGLSVQALDGTPLFIFPFYSEVNVGLPYLFSPSIVRSRCVQEVRVRVMQFLNYIGILVAKFQYLV
jgi:hypothetical protein